jgi:hypothetical protein
MIYRPQETETSIFEILKAFWLFPLIPASFVILFLVSILAKKFLKR